MLAILKIGSSNELVVTKNNKLCYAFTLTKGKMLNETYKYLKGMDIKELRVIMTPIVRTEGGNTDDMIISEFVGETINRRCYISRHDVAKLKRLCADLNVTQLKLYSLFDLYKLIGRRKPAVICGEYKDNFVYYIYVDKNGVRDFRETTSPDSQTAVSMLEFSNTPYIVSEFNLELDGVLRNRYTNIDELRDEELEKIYPNLSTDFITPNMMIPISPGDSIADMPIPEIHEEEDVLEEEPFVEEVEDEYEDDEDIEEVAAITATRGKLGRVKPNKEPNVPPTNRLMDLGLTIAGVFVAIILSLSLFANKQLSAETDNILEKGEQLEEVIAPMKDNVNYLNDYATVLENGGPTDNAVIEQLSKITIDGVLSEVVLKQKTVGIIVYLADEKAIDKFTEELNKVMTVSEVSKEGKLGLDSTSLNKFIIHGTLK